MMIIQNKYPERNIFYAGESVTFRLSGGAQISAAFVRTTLGHAETLRQAQQNPQQYRDLQIRVCGWNAHFTSMNEKEQNAFIDAAESAQ